LENALWWAARLIDEGLDRPETPPSTPEQPMVPIAIERRSRRQVFGAPKIPDHVYAAIEEALIEHGMTWSTAGKSCSGQRRCQSSTPCRSALGDRSNSTETSS
jgi:hypothetical protein